MGRALKSSIVGIAFDLDDTLLDTSALLIPQAVKESCEKMVEAGLNCSLGNCIEERRLILQLNPRASVYHDLVVRLGVKTGADQALVERAGYRAFHERKIPDIVAPISGSAEMLERLQKKYDLYLVTSGDPGTQSTKVQKLGIGRFFKKIYYVNAELGETKQEAFREIKATRGANVAAHSWLSVGNRLDAEIACAKKEGWQTAWVKWGEHAHDVAHYDFEEPDYTIGHLSDLETTCSL